MKKSPNFPNFHHKKHPILTNVHANPTPPLSCRPYTPQEKHTGQNTPTPPSRTTIQEEPARLCECPKLISSKPTRFFAPSIKTFRTFANKLPILCKTFSPPTISGSRSGICRYLQHVGMPISDFATLHQKQVGTIPVLKSRQGLRCESTHHFPRGHRPYTHTQIKHSFHAKMARYDRKPVPHGNIMAHKTTWQGFC